MTRCICSALRAAARRLTQAYDEALVSQGLNTPQFALLNRLAVWPGAPPTMRSLAAELGLDRTTLTHNLRPLERDGLVAVTPDPRDRRARRIDLTPLGHAKRNACRPLWEAAQEGFTQSFGLERTQTLLEALASIAALRTDPPSDTSHAL